MKTIMVAKQKGGVGATTLARELGVAASTVRHHIDNARAKLDASSRAEAVALLAVSGEI